MRSELMNLICCLFLLLASVIASPLYRRNDTDTGNSVRNDFNLPNTMNSVRLPGTATPTTAEEVISINTDNLSGLSENSEDFQDDLEGTSTDNEADYRSADEMIGIYTGSTRLRYVYAVHMELEEEQQFIKILEVLCLETLESILLRFKNLELVSILPVPSEDQDPDIVGMELFYVNFSDLSKYETVTFEVSSDRSVVANVMASVKALSYKIAKSQCPLAHAHSALACAPSALARAFSAPAALNTL